MRLVARGGGVARDAGPQAASVMATPPRRTSRRVISDIAVSVSNYSARATPRCVRRRMTRSWLIALLVACGGAPHPPPAAPPVAQVKEPKSIVIVWSRYADFSGHGFTGEGRFYARDGAGWTSVNCSVSHVADPQAGPNNHQQTCDARVTVPDTQWPTIESVAPRPGYEENDVTCEKRPDVCTALDVPDKTMHPPH